jgi:hypothetical protein
MRNHWRNIFNKSADKVPYSVLPITHVLEAGKVPDYNQLGEDEFGNNIISTIEPESLRMSSKDWAAMGLPSMGEDVEQVNMYGADLQENAQSAKLFESFINYPQDILTKAISDIYEEFAKKFDMDKFPIESSEKHNPVNQMRPMQEILIVIQIRCVTANDAMGALIDENIKQRPSNLCEVRNQEIMIRTQIHIYELGKFEYPGSLEDEFAVKYCRAQAKMEGTRFTGATQIAVTGSLIGCLDERSKNKSLMTFKIAATKIVQAFVTVNGVQVGKVLEETPEEKSRALLAHGIQTNEARQRYAKSQMEIDINTLKRENASLKNQVNQLKLKLEKFYAQTDSAKENPTYPRSAGADKKRKFNERAKKAKEEHHQDTSSKSADSGFRILPTGPPTSDNEDDDEVSEPSKPARANFARVIRNVEKPAAESVAPVAPVTNQNETVTITARSMVTRHVARRMIDIVMEQEEIDQQAEQIHSDQFEGQQNISDDGELLDLPDLVESDDEEDEPTNIPSICSFQVYGSSYITPDMVNTHIFCDDHILTLKSNGDVIPMSYVHRGPVYPTDVGQQVTVELQTL